MDVTLPSGVVIRGVPEGTTKDQIKAKALASGLATEQDFSGSGNTISPKVEPRGANAPGVGLLNPSIIEPALQVGSGLVNSSVGGLAAIAGGAAEFVRQGFSDQPFNKGEVVNSAQQAMDSAPQIPNYEPQTEQGKRGAEVLGNVMESPYNPINYPRQINEATQASNRLAQSGYPLAATALDVGGDLLAGYGAGKLVQKGAQAASARQAQNALTQQDIARRIIERTGDKDLASLTVERPSGGGSLTPQTAKVRKDSEAAQTVKQGFDDGTLSAIKATSQINRQKLLKMVQVKERGKQNSTYGATNRPSDVVGDSLAERIKYVKTINTRAGNELDVVAGNLRGNAVDISSPINTLKSELSGAGVRFGANGEPKFKGSDFEGDGASQKVISLILERSASPRVADAYYAHRIKRFIDNKTTYGASKAGATGDAERIIKNFRRNIDQKLDGSFPEYNKVNTQYSETVNALDSFKDAAGSKVNLFGENADKALGTASRRLLSNAQSRVNLMDSIKSLEGVSKKYGADFKDDIMTQVMFVDELDKVFGASAKTSLLGDIEKGTRTALETAAGQRTLTGSAIEGAAKVAQKAMGINEKEAFKSIKRLLARDDSYIQ